MLRDGLNIFNSTLMDMTRQITQTINENRISTDDITVPAEGLPFADLSDLRTAQTFETNLGIAVPAVSFSVVQAIIEILQQSADSRKIRCLSHVQEQFRFRA